MSCCPSDYLCFTTISNKYYLIRLNSTLQKDLLLLSLQFFSFDGKEDKGKEKSEIPIQNNTLAFSSFLFFSELYIQFGFLENLFNHMIHKPEECVVISMLFVVGVLFMLIFSCPWRKIKCF